MLTIYLWPWQFTDEAQEAEYAMAARMVDVGDYSRNTWRGSVLMPGHDIFGTTGTVSCALGLMFSFGRVGRRGGIQLWRHGRRHRRLGAAGVPKRHANARDQGDGAADGRHGRAYRDAAFSGQGQQPKGQRPASHLHRLGRSHRPCTRHAPVRLQPPGKFFLYFKRTTDGFC
jgi:hypothetical protein